MLNFDGEFDVNARSEDAYNYVSDPDRIAKLVPDLISYTKIDGNNMKLTAKAGVSFFNFVNFGVRSFLSVLLPSISTGRFARKKSQNFIPSCISTYFESEFIKGDIIIMIIH